MRRLAAGILTAAILALLLWTGVRRPEGADEAEARAGRGGDAPAAPDPAAGAEQGVRDLMDAAKRGDVAAYLAAFDEPLKSRLAREAEERGREAFAADLREAARSRKGHAIFAPEPDGPDAVRIPVEVIFTDRIERQTYRLERRDGAWLVTDLETVRGRAPREKYGAPAVFIAPEGVPVPDGAPDATQDEALAPAPEAGDPFINLMPDPTSNPVPRS